jgi:hypothetical protein
VIVVMLKRESPSDKAHLRYQTWKTRKRLLYVYKYPDAAVKIWTDKMKSGGKFTDEEIDKIFAYADAANNDNLIESLDKYF